MTERHDPGSASAAPALTSAPGVPALGRGTSRWDRALRTHTRVVVVLIAVSVAANLVIPFFPGGADTSVLAAVLGGLGAAAVFRWPHVGLALAVAAAPVAAAEGAVTTGPWSMACFVACLLTLRGASAWVTGGVTAVSNLVAAAWEVQTLDIDVNAAGSVAAFAGIAAAAAGSAVRGNLRYRQEAEHRLDAAEASRTAAVKHGVTQERLRIARDLHDSVGHQIAVANMRLGAAEVHLPDGSERSREELGAAREALRTVLQETQGILRVLRLGDVPEDGAHSASAVPGLVATFRDAGLPIEDRIEDLGPVLAPSAGAALFRIVQEGLTNAQKHGAGPVSLTVERVGPRARVEIVNLRNRRATSPPSGGNGLAGLRERIESVAGDLEIRCGDELFWLIAHIPAAGTPPPEQEGTADGESHARR